MSIIWFDVCALCVAATVLYAYLLRRSLRLPQNIIYLAQVCCVLLTTTAGIGSVVSQRIAHEAMVDAPYTAIVGGSMYLSSRIRLHFFSYLYFTSHILTPFLFVIYIYAILGVTSAAWKDFPKLFLMLTVSALALLSTPFTNAIFYYDRENVYHRGNLIWILYAAAFYYVIYSVYLILRFRKTIRRDFLLSLFSFSGFALTGVLIQMLEPRYRVENFFNTLVLLMLYISIERPADYIDSQTGLQNEYAFRINADISLKRGKTLHLILITIDNLKSLDKLLGTAESDVLVSEAAQMLGRVHKNSVLYRLERDSFALVLKKGDESEPAELIRKIHFGFKDPFPTGAHSIQLFECCCYMNCPRDAKALEELMRLIALASVSETHRSRHRIPVEELDLAADEREREIDRLLKTTDWKDLFTIRYQPVYRVADGRFSEARVHVEIREAGKGTLMWNEFDPVAERNGTASDISMYILESMCALIEEDLPEECGITSFAMKLPTALLMAKDGADQIIEITERHQVKHEMITFELTERVLMAYRGMVESNILMLKEEGFRFALVDYGNGYTDAGAVLKMPLSSVTFDPSLTVEAQVSRQADTLLRCSVEMLKRFRLEIKIDGIESLEERNYALNLGCDMMQGGYLSENLSGSGLLILVKGGAYAGL